MADRMPHICPTSPLPTIDGIMSSFASSLTYPPSVKVPGPVLNLIGLPAPLYTGLNLPNVETVQTAIQLQAFQMQTTMLGMINPMLALTGGSLDSFLPKIPGLPGMTLVDLLSGNPSALISSTEAAIANKVTWPTVPNPILPGMTVPAIATPLTLQMIVAGYMQTLSNSITGLIGQVTNILEIGNISGLPTFPDAGSVMSSAQDAIAHKTGSIQSALSALSFPGFPGLPALPNPLVPSFDIPSLTSAYCITALYNNLSLGMLAPIMNFIQNVLSQFLSFSFPITCIDL